MLVIGLLFFQCTKQDTVKITDDNSEHLTINEEDIIAFHNDFSKLLLDIEKDLLQYDISTEEELKEKLDSKKINQFLSEYQVEVNILSTNTEILTESNEFRMLKESMLAITNKTNTLNDYRGCSYGIAQKCYSNCFDYDFQTIYGTFIIQAAGCMVTGPAQPACSAAVLANFIWKSGRLNAKCETLCCNPSSS